MRTKKPYQTRFADMHDPRCERRTFKATAGPSTTGRTIVYIVCPWCGHEITAFLWSLSGSGKRCKCGAIFGGYGTGFKLLDPPARLL